MGDQHRHTKYSQKSVPRKKRAVQLYGEGEDSGKWYKCWNCGFINDSGRSIRGDTYEGGDGSIALEDSNTTPSPFGQGDSRYAVETIDMLTNNFIASYLVQLNADGDAITPYVSREPNITGGCSFCGCKNYF